MPNAKLSMIAILVLVLAIGLFDMSRKLKDRDIAIVALMKQHTLHKTEIKTLKEQLEIQTKQIQEDHEKLQFKNTELAALHIDVALAQAEA